MRDAEIIVRAVFVVFVVVLGVGSSVLVIERGSGASRRD